jgi:serine protease
MTPPSRRARPTLAALLALLAALTAFTGAPQRAGAQSPPPYMRPAVVAAPEDPSDARVIVKYKAGSALMQARAGGPRVVPRHAAALGSRLGLPLRDGRVLGERMQGLHGQGATTSELVARLAQQADVEWVVPDGRRYIAAAAIPAPNDPLYGPQTGSTTPAVGQWYLRAPDSSAPSAINAAGAWNITLGSPDITVAVLDTGVRFEHPDLIGKLHPGYDFVSDPVNAGDGGGIDGDATDPGDNRTRNLCASSPSASNSSWHGTRTAGLVGAATDNSIGMASVGRNVMVLPVRVLGKCGGSDSDILAGMLWAAGLSTGDANYPAPVNPHPAKVLNMSLGSSCAGVGSSCNPTCPASYQTVIDELTANGVTVVASAGNDSGQRVSAPANCRGVVAVAAVRNVGSKVGYSSVGPEVAISAPGGNCINTTGTCLYPLITTTNAGTQGPSTSTYSDGSDSEFGTSFSAPLVAGTLALMLSVDSSLSPAALISALKGSATPFPTSGGSAGTAACKAPTTATQLECYCTTSTCGAGMLNAAAAVAAVLPAVIGPPTAAIVASPASPTAGASVSLSASGSRAYGGRTVASYLWKIEGSSTASFSGDPSQPAVTLQTKDAGTVTVSLLVTDSAGVTGSGTLAITVQPTPVTTPAAPGGGGGGGAMSWAWVLGLLLAAFCLQHARPARLRAASRRA